MSAEIIVNESRQKGNPLLKEIRHVKVVYMKDIVPDFIVGASACVMFISVRFHMLKPEFLSRRLAELKTVQFRLRVLLCLVDNDDHREAMHAINLAAIRSECTLILAHSSREAARFLECFKAYEHNNGAAIKEKIDKDHISKLTDILTTIKPLNKTDVVTLARTFGSFRNIVNAPQSQLQECPGLGDKKLSNLREVLDQPFSTAARLRRQQKKRPAAAIDTSDQNEDQNKDADEDNIEALSSSHQSYIEHTSSLKRSLIPPPPQPIQQPPPSSLSAVTTNRKQAPHPPLPPPPRAANT
mmetsp:Transcript_7670/g.11560  ORF Transcript_7670/g.11560 Transcript_7670/m.11560 type:complete len:298 (+) Transcript_7670:73-966(+)